MNSIIGFFPYQQVTTLAQFFKELVVYLYYLSSEYYNSHFRDIGKCWVFDVSQVFWNMKLLLSAYGQCFQMLWVMHIYETQPQDTLMRRFRWKWQSEQYFKKTKIELRMNGRGQASWSLRVRTPKRWEQRAEKKLFRQRCRKWISDSALLFPSQRWAQLSRKMWRYAEAELSAK